MASGNESSTPIPVGFPVKGENEFIIPEDSGDESDIVLPTLPIHSRSIQFDWVSVSVVYARDKKRAEL